MSSPNRVSAGVAARPTHRVVALADVLVALSAAAGLAATYYLAVRTRTGQVLDTRAMDLTAHALLGAHWTETLLALISPATVSLAITALGVLAWAFKGATAAVEATCTAVGTILAAIVLKAVLERPMFFDTGANSLPSGHVAAVAGVAAAVALLTSRAARPIVIATGAGAVALTGVATLALGWHRPSDVLASALVAIGVARTTRWTVAVCGRRGKPTTPTDAAAVAGQEAVRFVRKAPSSLGERRAHLGRWRDDLRSRCAVLGSVAGGKRAGASAYTSAAARGPCGTGHGARAAAKVV